MAGSEEATPRRRALARRAGVVPASAAWAAAGAWMGAAIALIAAGGAAAGVLRAWAVDAWSAPSDAIGRAHDFGSDPLIAMVVRLAAPLAIAAAAAALVGHGALVRGAWLPRRSIRGAPVPAGGLLRRGGDALLACARAALIAATAARFAVVHLGDAARLGAWPPSTAAADALALVGAGVVHVAIAIAAVGLIDALERVRRHRADLRMTPRELRDELREQQGDPRWRRARRQAAAADDAAARIRTAAVVVAGDRVAAAVRWHAHAFPIPTVVARGRGPRATQAIALARRAVVPIVHAPALAAELASVAPGAPVPARLHEALAAILTSVPPR